MNNLLLPATVIIGSYIFHRRRKRISSSQQRNFTEENPSAASKNTPSVPAEHIYSSDHEENPTAVSLSADDDKQPGHQQNAQPVPADASIETSGSQDFVSANDSPSVTAISTKGVVQSDNENQDSSESSLKSQSVNNVTYKDKKDDIKKEKPDISVGQIGDVKQIGEVLTNESSNATTPPSEIPSFEPASHYDNAHLKNDASSDKESSSAQPLSSVKTETVSAKTDPPVLVNSFEPNPDGYWIQKESDTHLDPEEENAAVSAPGDPPNAAPPTACIPIPKSLSHHERYENPVSELAFVETNSFREPVLASDPVSTPVITSQNLSRTTHPENGTNQTISASASESSELGQTCTPQFEPEEPKKAVPDITSDQIGEEIESEPEEKKEEDPPVFSDQVEEEVESQLSTTPFNNSDDSSNSGLSVDTDSQNARTPPKSEPEWAQLATPLPNTEEAKKVQPDNPWTHIGKETDNEPVKNEKKEPDTAANQIGGEVEIEREKAQKEKPDVPFPLVGKEVNGELSTIVILHSQDESNSEHSPDGDPENANATSASAPTLAVRQTPLPPLAPQGRKSEEQNTSEKHIGEEVRTEPEAITKKEPDVPFDPIEEDCVAEETDREEPGLTFHEISEESQPEEEKNGDSGITSDEIGAESDIEEGKKEEPNVPSDKIGEECETEEPGFTSIEIGEEDQPEETIKEEPDVTSEKIGEENDVEEATKDEPNVTSDEIGEKLQLEEAKKEEPRVTYEDIGDQNDTEEAAEEEPDFPSHEIGEEDHPEEIEKVESDVLLDQTEEECVTEEPEKEEREPNVTPDEIREEIDPEETKKEEPDVPSNQIGEVCAAEETRKEEPDVTTSHEIGEEDQLEGEKNEEPDVPLDQVRGEVETELEETKKVEPATPCDQIREEVASDPEGAENEEPDAPSYQIREGAETDSNSGPSTNTDSKDTNTTSEVTPEFGQSAAHLLDTEETKKDERNSSSDQIGEAIGSEPSNILLPDSQPALQPEYEALVDIVPMSQPDTPKGIENGSNTDGDVMTSAESTTTTARVPAVELWSQTENDDVDQIPSATKNPLEGTEVGTANREPPGLSIAFEMKPDTCGICDKLEATPNPKQEGGFESSLPKSNPSDDLSPIQTDVEETPTDTGSVTDISPAVNPKLSSDDSVQVAPSTDVEEKKGKLLSIETNNIVDTENWEEGMERLCEQLKREAENWKQPAPI